jgi:hypothetical protein
LTFGSGKSEESAGGEIRDVKAGWSASGFFAALRMTAGACNNNDKCAVVAGIGAGGEADFSAAAANAPPSVEMTGLLVGEKKQHQDEYRGPSLRSG